jgi:ABC-2 type transport system permease protein
MIAVLRHELASYFTNVTGYVFGAFLLLFGGIYTMVININAAVSSFEYVLSNMSFVFLVIVPILTMRVIAEERRQKTDQLLYALPIRMTQVALGKYLALLIVFLVPVAILGLFPLLLSAYGDVYLPAAYGTLVGFFFLGAALIAIGMFISSVTESQAVAAGLCFVVMLVNYFMSSLTDYIPSTTQASLVAFTIAALLLGLVIDRLTRSFVAGAAVTIIIIVGLLAVFFVDSSLLAGRFSAVVSQLSLFERFYVFVNGVFDVTGIVYFLSVIGVFLFLTVQSLEKRRWSE